MPSCRGAVLVRAADDSTCGRSESHGRVTRRWSTRRDRRATPRRAALPHQVCRADVVAGRSPAPWRWPHFPGVTASPMAAGTSVSFVDVGLMEEALTSSDDDTKSMLWGGAPRRPARDRSHGRGLISPRPQPLTRRFGRGNPRRRRSTCDLPLRPGPGARRGRHRDPPRLDAVGHRHRCRRLRPDVRPAPGDAGEGLAAKRGWMVGAGDERQLTPPGGYSQTAQSWRFPASSAGPHRGRMRRRHGRRHGRRHRLTARPGRSSIWQAGAVGAVAQPVRAWDS
jgi:hypothetical protein